MRSYHYHRESDQLPVRGVTTESIMRTATFACGVADKRSGQPPRYDDFMFDQEAGDQMAKATINAHWHYERGRQWASLAPLDMPLKVDGKLNPKAIALCRAAAGQEYVV
jgi:hypothetical protein